MEQEKTAYRIAFLTADWNYELVEDTLHGLKRYIDDHREISLFLFDCFGKDVDNAASLSEYAIYRLPDLHYFDGILIQGNQIVLNQIRDELSARIQATGIPAVSIGCPMEGCTLFSFDNQRAEHDLVSHVIEAHRSKRLVYLTGLLNNGCPEAQLRLDGFLDACREHGIPEADQTVIPCTWRASDGYSLAQRYTQEHLPLPDAFICANDEMALGLIEGLREADIRVPRDVLVTGFDNLTSAELSSPRLSSIQADYRAINYEALELLMRKIRGEAVSDQVSFSYDIVCSESCGCPTVSRPGLVREKYFRQTRFLQRFYFLQDQMAEALFESDNLFQLMRTVEQHLSIFGCDKAYLCINDFYYDNYDKTQWNHDSETFGDEMILAACWGGEQTIRPEQVIRFPTRQLLPESVLRQEPFLIFYPLHYNTYSIGYLALNGISAAARMNLHESIINFLEIAIENVRKKELLRKLNDALRDLYVHDALTGLYNRFGYTRFAARTFEVLRASSGGAQLLFADLDNMKGINDRFGHACGDQAIRAAADILRSTCGPDSFIMRYGGDEFVAILSGEIRNITQLIRDAVARFNASGLAPFRLGLSTGVIQADDQELQTLEQCVRAADALMYEIKKNKGASI